MELIPDSDTSGTMREKSISEHQGAFLKVDINQLITSVDPSGLSSPKERNKLLAVT